jgi:hypothetical protein
LKERILISLLLLSLSLGGRIPDTRAPEVEVTLTTGESLTGEILSVREQSVLLTTRYGAGEEVLVDNKSLVRVVDLELIKEVALPGSSHMVHGMGIGMALGCLAGCLIGGSQEVSNQKNDIFGCSGWAEKNANACSGGLIGGSGGTLVGAGVGGALSGNDIILFGHNKRDPAALRSVARYYDKEPEFLKSVGTMTN